MKLNKPQIGFLEETNNLLAEIEIAFKEDIDIKRKKILNISLNSINADVIEFNSCIFENCKIIESNMGKVSFTDVIFNNCDFSNTSFEESNFVRCIFNNCKMIGTSFIEAKLYNIEICDSISNYANFNLAMMEKIIFNNTELKSVCFQQNKFKDIEYNNCDLQLTQFFNTKLNNIDFRNSNISRNSCWNRRY